MAAFDAVQPAVAQATSALGSALQKEGAEGETLTRYQALQTALNGLDSKSLSSVGWWPDGYDRFTNALSALQALREQIVMDNRLTLAPWLETYLLTQISTQHAPDLIERVGRLASRRPGFGGVRAIHFAKSPATARLRSRIGDAREQLVKTAGLLEARLPSALQAWAGQYHDSLKRLDAGLKVLDDGVFGGSITLKPEDFERSLDALLGDLAALRQQSLVSLDQRLDYHGSAIRQFIVSRRCSVACCWRRCTCSSACKPRSAAAPAASPCWPKPCVTAT
jgi:hypothetical protein